MGKQGVKRTKENHQNYVQQKQREAAAAEAEAAGSASMRTISGSSTIK